jgi:hypothetical protein
MDNVLDEGLEILGDAGAEYEAFGGAITLANHGPMVMEALCALGREEAVPRWAMRYRPRLQRRPDRNERIVLDSWISALGEMDRIRDWVDLFDAELSEEHWTNVADRWIPRLAPGMVGGIHGAIRTAHAVRSLGRAETTPRVRELAEGLGYWAAGYMRLPEQNSESKSLLPSQVLPQLEQLDLTDRTGWIRFTDPIGKLATLPSFASVTSQVDVQDDPSVVVNDLAKTFAAILISNNQAVSPRALCHGLTTGTLYRMMSPHVSTEATSAVLRYSWQTASAFYCALVLNPPAEQPDVPTRDVDAIVDEAIACPDEHAIKVTEACLREYELDPDPVLLAAALGTTRRLAEVGLNLY